ncbi:MAG: hypothetical protein OEY88_06535 [Candidatus Bathyarchaeota archaeon]|nr:hypothetical protein [Candidatus Bathyarchaeota archaeon]
MIEKVSEAVESETFKQSYATKHIGRLEIPHLYTKTAKEIAIKRN